VQERTDAAGGEVSGAEIFAIFTDEYLPSPSGTPDWGRFALRSTRSVSEVDGADALEVTLLDSGRPVTVHGTGNGPIAAFCAALASVDGVDVRVLDYAEHALSAGGDARAAAYVECAVEGRVLWGVGVDPNITTASLKAIVSAVNRALR
jgi:2-isopropylmalate synthase